MKSVFSKKSKRPYLKTMEQSPRFALTANSIVVAKNLLGQYLVREQNGQKLIGRIVETESYHQDDPAAHSYSGQTARNAVMFGAAGHAYVYFTYGMHYCFNVVCGPVGRAEAVLIRALEPVEGIGQMKQNRHMDDIHTLCSGPAKLCYALGIDKTFNGHDLTKPPLYLKKGEHVPLENIIATTRIGITKAAAEPLRFYIKDNPFVSKK